MSWGESKRSRYGGVSELTGRSRIFSGELAAIEASFDRNESLGFIGGMGILAEFFAPIAELQLILKLFLVFLSDCELVEVEDGTEQAIGRA